MKQFFDCTGSVECIIHVLIFKRGNLRSSVTFDDLFIQSDNTGSRGRIIFVISLRFIFRLIAKNNDGNFCISFIHV